MSKNVIKAKLFRCNDYGVAEWCIAENEKQAYEFMKELWGADTMKEYEDDYIRDSDLTLDDFINDFFIEEAEDKDFSIADEHGKPVTKKVSEWILNAKEVPSYLCFGD